ncbi:MAG: class I SAM-dependent methyltransferase [Armatimonadetes bacterium]|nr:class I SAM-dependent methyltransferase [Armatimonadota bacterium]
MEPPVCRFCGQPLTVTFVDLGMSPLCESFLSADHLNDMEPFYPLHVYVCDACLLVQLEEYVSPETIFGEYAYFSSYSTSWLEHAKRYVDGMVGRLGLASGSHVVEVASNDGYLLQYFLPHGIVPLGIEPASNVACEAEEKGVPTLVEFFTVELARQLVRQGRGADLIVGNNVLAQVPDLHDFVEGLKILLRPGGTVTLEFPHILRLMKDNQFDTIYHEHFSYFSLLSAERIFGAHGLIVYDVDVLETHGGSLRLYLRHADETSPQVTTGVETLRQQESTEGLAELSGYLSFAPRVERTKRRLLEFLIDAKDQGRSVAGYGAPGKGNTLLNYCGIRTDLLDYTVDRNPHKWGMFLPGTHIPVHPPERLAETRPDYVLILPWNLKQEIMAQLEYVREWGGRFVIPIPEVQVL